MYNTNCTNEAIIKIIGKISQEFSEFQDLQKQISLRKTLEEALYEYGVITKEKSLVSSDLNEKMQIFFASKRLEGMSKQTERNYGYILSKFSQHLIKPIISITSIDLRMYLSAIGKGIKPNSVNNTIYCLKSFFSWLFDNDYIVKNPMNNIKPIKIPQRLRHALNEEELELLRESCKTIREEALIEFLISTGCRLSEVVNINKSNINWYEMSLHVVGKGNKERVVYFNIKAKILLKKYLKSRNDNNTALFVASKKPHNRLGGRSIEKELKNIASRTKIDKSIYPHLIRHSFATHNINSGMPLDIIQSLMGHEDPATTLIYAQLSQENIKHEYARIY